MAATFRPDALRPAEDTRLEATAHAGFWRRVAAAVIDIVVLSLAMLVVIVLIVRTLGVEPERWSAEDTVYWLLNTAMVWLYYAGQEGGVRQATLGKRLLGLRVTDLDGEAISFARASLRHFAKLASLIPFMTGFLAVAVTPRKQGFHDMIAGCLVVRADGGGG